MKQDARLCRSQQAICDNGGAQIVPGAGLKYCRTSSWCCGIVRPVSTRLGTMKKYYWIMMPLVLALTGCVENYVEPLLFGAIAWPKYDPAYVARELGYPDADQVHLAEFTNTTEVLRAFRNGQLHVAGLTLGEAPSLRQSVPDPQVFLVADVSNGADVPTARRGFKSLSRLKGRRIGLGKTAPGASAPDIQLILKGIGLGAGSDDLSLLANQYIVAGTDLG